MPEVSLEDTPTSSFAQTHTPTSSFEMVLEASEPIVAEAPGAVEPIELQAKKKRLFRDFKDIHVFAKEQEFESWFLTEKEKWRM